LERFRLPEAHRLELLECAPILAEALARECLDHLDLIETLWRRLTHAVGQVTAQGVMICDPDDVVADFESLPRRIEQRRRSTTSMRRYFHACDGAPNEALERALQDLIDDCDDCAGDESSLAGDRDARAVRFR
jgi:hypothetical protein